MKQSPPKVIRIITVAALLLVVLTSTSILLRNPIIKLGIQKGIESTFGTRAVIEKLDVGLTQSFMRIEGLTLYNPQGFKEGVLARVPLIYVDYELSPLLNRQLHCIELMATVNELVVIKNEEGEANLTRLKPSSREGNEALAKKYREKDTRLEIKIDKFILSLDQVRLVDYTRRGKPKERKITLNISQMEFRNVTSLEEIASSVFKIVTTAGLHNRGMVTDGLVDTGRQMGSKDIGVLKEFSEKISP